MNNRYTEIAPNGQILRQSSIIPPDVVSNYLTAQGSMSYNSTFSNTQSTSYPYQTAKTRQWWQSAGSFNPYRTTYQDYGGPKQQSNSMSNVFYTQPTIYNQSFNKNDSNWNSFTTMPYNSPQPPQYM